MGDLSETFVARMPIDNEELAYVEIVQDGIRTRASDYVVVYADPAGGHNLIYNTDSCTIGIAAELIAEEADRMIGAEQDELNKYKVLVSWLLNKIVSTVGEETVDEQD